MKIFLRLLLSLFANAALLSPVVWAQVATQNPASNPPIDRHALVTRHNVLLTRLDAEHPLQVGNGEFAFGMDITGLQTFAPFNTMSHWGWHSGPIPNGERLEDFQGQIWDTHGRSVRYPMPDPEHPELSSWLSSNPHRINLGRIGLLLTKIDGTPVVDTDIENARQSLDLWSGIVTSRFELEGQPVMVKTVSHPEIDAVAVQVQSPLIKAGRIGVFFACPGDDPRHFASYVGDWSHPGQFEIQPSAGKGRVDFIRRLDATAYHMGLRWQGEARLSERKDVPAPLKILKAEYGAQLV
ncbi:MAG: hypothetical protein EOP06_06730, partial [Proteobacteria bacterium]